MNEMTLPAEPTIDQAFHLRIPLPGYVRYGRQRDAIVILPARWIAEVDWQQLMAVLEAMKPTLVISDEGEEAT